MNELELTGRARTHIRQFSSLGFAAHEQAAEAFFRMKRDAEADGIVLHPLSAFRDFAAQSTIWNLKFRGERPLCAEDGQELEAESMDAAARIRAILRWSALPGASRHHWGSDIDVIDSAALPAGYQVRLVPQETEPGGIFHRLHAWMDTHMAAYGFFRPYARYQSGVCAEPWHISYAPVSRPALESLSLGIIQRAVADSNIDGREIVQSILPEIYETYILNICTP